MRVEPKLIIQTLITNEDRVRLTARQLGISPGTVINWQRRAKTGRLAYAFRYSTGGLVRRSTKPKTRRLTSLAAADQDELVRLRRRHGLGARKLKVLTGVSVHHNTVHRFLKAKGLTVPGRNYRRPRYQTTTHMYVGNAKTTGKLQMDVKYVTPQLSGLAHTVYLYAIMDIFSRFKLGLMLPSLDQALAIRTAGEIVPWLPFKSDFIQTDNGLEFQNRFSEFVQRELKLRHHYIHKSSPNENAVIERSFRTDEEEFFFRLDKRPKDLNELNLLYQEFLVYYNTERPHLGIDLQTPVAKIRSVQ
ncbi:MAG: integrase core domain-containing protein [Candidatus Saccharimonadales bacterium]